ncbi:MAG: zinc ribbon domain-containing protein [Rhodoluna sp.]
MNLDKPGQQALLKLAELDLEIAHLKHEIAKAIDNKQLNDLTEAQTASAGELLEARTRLENFESEVKRSEDDIRLVTERLERDRTRLNSTSSPKDAIGIQAEINSLLKRKDDLESIELALLQDLESAEAQFQQISAERESAQQEIESIRTSIQHRVDELKAQGRKASADREIVIAKIPVEVLSRYQVLAARQIAVGQVIDRACSACRMTLTVGAIDALTNLAEDQIGSCPECQAMIIQ